MAKGSVLADRYVLADELGRGSTGVVYRAERQDDGAIVAIKVMSPAYATGAGPRARFLREARVASALDHPRAAQVLDYGEDREWLFLVMTLLEGEPLRVRLARRVAPVGDIVAVAGQLSDVLSAAHEIDLIHRDIKPENIFALRAANEADELSVRVLDFGLAFLAEHDGSLGRLTQEGVLGGTPAYMSPEQAQGEALTAKTDIYSLGCVLYEMVAGEVPFVGGVPETLARHAFVAPVRLSSRKLERPVPEALTTLIGAMLVKPAGERPSADEVATRLRDL